MDLLKEENGTTILESLVVILLLGILITLTAGFFTTVFNNKNMLKGEALLIAQQEISRTISEVSERDTSYTNETGNLSVRRIVYKDTELCKVEVLVSKASTDSLIISLKANYNR